MEYAITQIILGWLYGHLVEYLIHKYILHDHNRFKNAFKRHFGTHHKISRKNEMYDEGYEKTFNSSSLFELGGLSLLLLSHLPLVYILPYFYCTLIYSALVYYSVHRLSHLYTDLGRKLLPWHYAHHMAKNQHENWGVRLPIFDLLLGTYSVENRDKA